MQADKACTIRTRKFITNRLLERKQFVSHPSFPCPAINTFATQGVPSRLELAGRDTGLGERAYVYISQQRVSAFWGFWFWQEEGHRSKIQLVRRPHVVV